MIIIGILMREENDKYYVKKELVDLFINKNCTPINIYDIGAIKLCDGVVIPGGNDIIKNDIEIIKYLYKNDIPTLGICLGMQEMGYLFNGKLSNNYNHLKPNKKYAHEVKIIKNTKLYEMLKQDSIKVNSRHKDYLINTDLFISGLSDVIESIEDKNKKFFIGVQWHPESMVNYDIYSNKIIDEFIKKSSKTAYL